MFNHCKKLIRHKCYKYYHGCYHGYNHDNFILNNVINLKKNPCYFDKIPVKNQNDVLKLMPYKFFSIHNLSNLTNVSMSIKLFNQYFGHIPMYYMENDKKSIITWMPEKLLETEQWYQTKIIYPIYYNDQNDNIVIKENHIIIKSYNIKYINMLNFKI